MGDEVYVLLLKRGPDDGGAHSGEQGKCPYENQDNDASRRPGGANQADWNPVDQSSDEYIYHAQMES